MEKPNSYTALHMYGNSSQTHNCLQAITYSNMQIHQGEEKSDVYVIVDI